MKLASVLGIRGEKEKPRDSYGSVTLLAGRRVAGCTTPCEL